MVDITKCPPGYAAFYGTSHLIDHLDEIASVTTGDEHCAAALNGAAKKSSVLTWESVRKIRRMSERFEGKELAKMFGVSPGTISAILTYRTWQE